MLRNVRPLRVKIFAFEFPDPPFALRLRAVEHGSFCELTDPKTVDELATMVSGLKLSHAERAPIDAALELRFYRPGQSSKRPLVEAFFDMSVSGGDAIGGSATPAVINGRLAMVYAKQVESILYHAGQISQPPGNKACSSYKEYDD